MVYQPKFSLTLQVEGFINWLHEVELIFDYKDVLNAMNVKLVRLFA